MDYVKASMEAVQSVDPDILVLQGAGISCGEDVYRVIYHGAQATGSSSGIITVSYTHLGEDERHQKSRIYLFWGSEYAV